MGRPNSLAWHICTLNIFVFTFNQVVGVLGKNAFACCAYHLEAKGGKIMLVQVTADSMGTFILGSYETTFSFSAVIEHHALKIESTETPKEYGTDWEQKIYHILVVEQGIVLVLETRWGFDGNEKSSAWNRYSSVRIIHIPDDYSGYDRVSTWNRYDMEGFLIR